MAWRAEAEKWLKLPVAERMKKPLMLYGSPMSGKKTLTTKWLQSKGYHVIRPRNSHEWMAQADHGLSGKHAFVIRPQDVGGSKMPPLVRNAPCVYVAINPYDHGTKAELNGRFRLVRMDTGHDFAPELPLPPVNLDDPASLLLAAATQSTSQWELRDRELNFWDATRALNQQRGLSLHAQLELVDGVDPYFAQVVYLSLTNFSHPTNPTERSHYWKLMAELAEGFSLANALEHHLSSSPSLSMNLLRIVIPLRMTRLPPNDLIVAEPSFMKLRSSTSTSTSSFVPDDPKWFSGLHSTPTLQQPKPKNSRKKRAAADAHVDEQADVTVQKPLPRKRAKPSTPRAPPKKSTAKRCRAAKNTPTKEETTIQ